MIGFWWFPKLELWFTYQKHIQISVPREKTQKISMNKTTLLLTLLLLTYFNKKEGKLCLPILLSWWNNTKTWWSGLCLAAASMEQMDKGENPLLSMFVSRKNMLKLEWFFQSLLKVSCQLYTVQDKDWPPVFFQKSINEHKWPFIVLGTVPSVDGNLCISKAYDIGFVIRERCW